MGLVYYQTVETVGPEELRALRAIKGKFNAGRSFSERIKLWRKGDILEGMEPRDARWGFTQVRDEEEKFRVISAIREMSAATPSLTWLLYDEDDNHGGLVIKGGKTHHKDLVV